jgi:hypothetical protein
VIDWLGVVTGASTMQVAFAANGGRAGIRRTGNGGEKCILVNETSMAKAYFDSERQ